jgi:hypothetical protein
MASAETLDVVLLLHDKL